MPDMAFQPNPGERPVHPDAEVRVRYRNGEITPFRAAKWWTNWRRSADAFSIAAYEERDAA